MILVVLGSLPVESVSRLGFSIAMAVLWDPRPGNCWELIDCHDCLYSTTLPVPIHHSPNCPGPSPVNNFTHFKFIIYITKSILNSCIILLLRQIKFKQINYMNWRYILFIFLPIPSFSCILTLIGIYASEATSGKWIKCSWLMNVSGKWIKYYGLSITVHLIDGALKHTETREEDRYTV